MRVGTENFDNVTVKIYKDNTARLEAHKAGEFHIMRFFSAGDTGARTDADTGAMRTAQNPPRAAPASKPPVLSVGVSDPDTQLILPWFLTDMIDAVNSHQSFGDFLNAMKAGL